jgi:hypothetical protein
LSPHFSSLFSFVLLSCFALVVVSLVNSQSFFSHTRWEIPCFVYSFQGWSKELPRTFERTKSNKKKSNICRAFKLCCAFTVAHSRTCNFSYGAITHSLTHPQHNDSYITSPCCFLLHNNTLCVGLNMNLCKRIDF